MSCGSPDTNGNERPRNRRQFSRLNVKARTRRTGAFRTRARANSSAAWAWHRGTTIIVGESEIARARPRRDRRWRLPAARALSLDYFPPPFFFCSLVAIFPGLASPDFPLNNQSSPPGPSASRKRFFSHSAQYRIAFIFLAAHHCRGSLYPPPSPKHTSLPHPVAPRGPRRISCFVRAHSNR